MTPRIIDQLRIIVELQGASPVAGTTSEEIADFERWLELTLPEQLRSWLLFCNGARDLLPPGYYGIGKSRSDWDIDASWVLTTQWPEFRKLDLERARKVMTHPILFDGRNLFDAREMDRQGWIYKSIGR